MATIPYQPTYTTTPKYGLRYGPSQFAPTTGTAGQGSASQQIPPATLGTQQGGYTMADPFSGNQQFAQQQASYAPTQASGVNTAAYYGQPIQGVSAQPTTGFRRLAPGVPQPTPVPTPTPTPPMTTEPPVQPTTYGMIDPFDGDDNFNQAQADYRNVASGLGYTRGTQNPASILGMIPGVGFAMNAFGYDPNEGYTYGQQGTYDAQGNVFGTEGRAFNPITGAPVASYGTATDAKNTIFGGYNKLRDAGESIPSSALGSYDNSIYNISRYDRMQGITPASKQGIDTTLGLARTNTMNIHPDAMRTDITPEMLGFTNARPMPSTPTGVIGTNTGDIYSTGSSYQAGIINESGQVETPTGTIVSVTDAYGQSRSLLNKDPEVNKQTLAEVKSTFESEKKSDEYDAGISAYEEQVRNDAASGKDGGMGPNRGYASSNPNADYTTVNTYDDDDAGEPSGGK